MKLTIHQDDIGLILKDDEDRIIALVPSDRPEIADAIVAALAATTEGNDR